MHYTLHLTNQCNMACTYCYVNKDQVISMERETAVKAVNMAAEAKNSTGIIFFGGEPLMQKNLIYETVEYCTWLEKKHRGRFHYKVTTNGLLLDEAFMEFSLQEHIFIAFSHDGIREAHDKHRVDNKGKGTFEKLAGKIELLLSKRPYAPVLMVVSPDTVEFYAESVQYLYQSGFRYLICSLNYAAAWTDRDLKKLKIQYEKLAAFYLDRTRAENKFYLSPFEVKISSHINGKTYIRERCELGKKQISVGPDGTLFPCVQFVGEKEFAMGHVDTGINEKRREALYGFNEAEKEDCSRCAIKSRCNHHCGCLNKQATGSMEKVSPVLCAHERILVPIADRLAEKLYQKRNPLFIQKHYNDMYPLLSLIEDQKTTHKSN
ncbi:radical SAM/SPASM domain-containing protein [Candidatus Formimonas warabiya]|uniref:Radical SAM/SPASM domain-containing protein n=2 Tax=Formimonas warabiya TaxID=1761012 RepID=A0A3G1L071_FORW1|nr:radical SAM/SPASM domain-containing protein [Candidatus Formimonas warabiya]